MVTMYEIKKNHIDDQIDTLKAVLNNDNVEKVSEEIEFQEWRLTLLGKYKDKTDHALKLARSKFKKELSEELWENRKTASLKYATKEQRNILVEVAIIDLFLGEY